MTLTWRRGTVASFQEPVHPLRNSYGTFRDDPLSPDDYPGNILRLGGHGRNFRVRERNTVGDILPKRS